MKRLMRTMMIAVALLGGLQSKAQLSPADAIKQMGRGINVGNTMEAPTEGSWNSAIKEYYFDDYKTAGFTCIRIPITWDGHTATTSPYAVNEAWLDRVEQVVDWALKRKLIVIINAHHETWLKEKYTADNMARFDSIWSQIAVRFKDKSDSLLFEMLNEPKGMTMTQVNGLNTRILSIIRKTNPTRIVLFSGNEWSNIDPMVNAAVPNDPYLIGYFHSYDPYPFGLVGTGTYGSASDYAASKAIFDKAQSWSALHNIPVIIGEFGSVKACDYNSRMRHYASITEQALNHNVAFAVWDDGGDFAIYQRSSRTWNELKDILIYTYKESPTSFVSSVNDDNTVSLSWINRTSANDSIVVERRIGSGSFIDIDTIASAQTTYTDLSTVVGNSYYYRLRTHLGDTMLYSYPTKVSVVAVERTPYKGKSFTIPGKVEAEYYDKGGEGLTYHDTDEANQPSSILRPSEAVDIEMHTDSGYHVAYVAAGEWIEYSVNVQSAGNYRVTARIASQNGGGKLGISFDGSKKAQLVVPKTTDWTNFEEVSSTVQLEAGEHILRIGIDALPEYNIDYLTFDNVTGLSVAEAEGSVQLYPNPVMNKFTVSCKIADPVRADIVDVYGKCVKSVLLQGKTNTVDVSDLISGIYIIRISNNDGQVVNQRFTKK
jgi:aryl-phospho-beta-D-glucosidase BglC (GH1 family)